MVPSPLDHTLSRCGNDAQAPAGVVCSTYRKLRCGPRHTAFIQMGRVRLRARQPLRGLMSTPKSLSFQGRFGRIFRSLPAATYGVTDAESRLALMTLASLVSQVSCAASRSRSSRQGGRPGGILIKRR
jgi:hypothetical protein